MSDAERKNRRILETLQTRDMELMGYDFIPKVLGKTHYAKWDNFILDRNFLRIQKMGHTLVSISWSYNESKIYFSAGPLCIRLVGTEDALEAALDAVDTVNRVFNELVKYHEL